MEKNDKTAYQALKKAIAENNLKKLYLLWGEENYLREYYFGRMKELILQDGPEIFNHKRFEGKNIDLEALSEAVDALPVFSTATLIEVRDYDLYRANEEKRTRVQSIFSNLPDYCTLVFIMTDSAFRPDARTKLHAALKKQGEIVEFAAQGQSDLVQWIRRRFAANDREIERNDAEYLIFTCGSLMTGLVSEIEKISAYSKSKKVTRQDIDAVATPVLDAVVFQMTNALSEKDFDRAAKIMAELIEMKESPIKLLAIIGRQMRQLYSARLALDSGRDVSYVKQLWEMKSDYPARQLLNAARRFSLRWCKDAVILCAETDFALKSAGVEDKELLKLLLIRLAG